MRIIADIHSMHSFIKMIAISVMFMLTTSCLVFILEFLSKEK